LISYGEILPVRRADDRSIVLPLGHDTCHRASTLNTGSNSSCRGFQVRKFRVGKLRFDLTSNFTTPLVFIRNRQVKVLTGLPVILRITKVLLMASEYWV
jgi:hypothetical protein